MARPKGIPNKLTQGARHAIFEVFDKIGGVDGLATWAVDNKSEYYKLWGKTIPQHTQLTGLDGGAIEHKDTTPMSEVDKQILEEYQRKLRGETK
jgi:hypothetical protein